MDPNSLALLMGSAGAAGGPATYVEDVFQTWLYTGNGSTQTITNGIDLSGKGGLVWIKKRSSADNHALFDTARGNTKRLISNLTGAESTVSDEITSFGSTGFTLGAGSTGFTNDNGVTFASWTFRKQAKFFDVVTYTGNGAESRNISHSLGATPGCIIIKCLSSSAGWAVWHRNNGTAPLNLGLNATWGYGAVIYSGFPQSATSSTFNVDNVSNDINSVSYHCNLNNETYVAYLFAHDAGGFGASGNDSVVSCGSFTMSSGDVTVNLGYEPQWLLIKSTGNAEWGLYDVMRGLNYTNPVRVTANTSNAEAAIGGNYLRPTPTGFVANSGWFGSSATFIYIAIRRGPMKTPTDATKVFGQVSRSGTGANATVTGGQVADLAIVKNHDATTDWLWASRLTGTGYLSSAATTAETAAGTTILQANPWDVMDGIKVGTTSLITNGSGGYTYINWLLRRAPGFFDVVAYTGTGSTRTVSHNLGVAPDLIIIKTRDDATSWYVYTGPLSPAGTTALRLNSTSSYEAGAPYWSSTAATASVFTVNNANVNESGFKYIAYLFGSVSGVSKVGSYTGTGTTLSVDCGFTAGARFVMIKRTDSTGDWYIWDTAHGIVSANEPFILFNSTGPGQYGYDYIDPLSSGFQISSTAPAAINANGGSFIYLAIA